MIRAQTYITDAHLRKKKQMNAHTSTMTMNSINKHITHHLEAGVAGGRLQCWFTSSLMFS